MIESKPINSNFNDEQWRAIQETGTNLLIAASAGSGKTTVLIERILTHIRKGYANLNQLLVVTFTEAAAGEMKERMEVKLREAVFDSRLADKQALFLEQIDQLPLAHIRTLHSFCLQVIQQFFYLIDFNPSFRLITDETQKSLIYQAAWENLLTDILSHRVDGLDGDDLRDLLSRYSNPGHDQGLYQFILKLYEFSRSHPNPDKWLNDLHLHSQEFGKFASSRLFKENMEPHLLSSINTAYQHLTTSIKRVKGLSSLAYNRYHPLLEDEQNKVNQALTDLLDGDFKSFVNHFRTIQFDRWPSLTKKIKENDDEDEIKAIKDLRDEAKEVLKTVQENFVFDFDVISSIEEKNAPIIQKIGHLCKLYQVYIQKEKETRNQIDYNDLEHLTLNILAPIDPLTGKRKGSIAASYYQNLFKEVLVDEYQDINEIQASILSWLSHDKIADLPGNLFMVGDVKQSIYGFRMAEPSLFLEKYKAYQKGEGGELIILDRNYRSRDEVLQFTNYIFERTMDEQFGQMRYGSPESLKTGNKQFQPPSPHTSFNIQILLHEKEGLEDDEEKTVSVEEDMTIEDSSHAQSHLIAQDIQNRLERQEQIYDKKLGMMRPLEYRDIVILTSTRGPFADLQEVFQEYEIPLNAQKVDTYFQRQEVQLMIAILKIIDNPLQDLPLVAILRSFFVGLTDDQLSQIRIANQGLGFHLATLAYAEAGNDEIADRLKVFYGQLNHWREIAEDLGLVDLIWTIYQETYFLDYVSGLQNGDQRKANLHALYQHAANFEKAETRGVFGFVQYIESMTEQEADIAEPLILSGDQNFVRVMTVHASKGLEFPLVYLMNINKTFNLQDIQAKPYVLSKDFGLGTDYYDFTQVIRYPSLIKNTIKMEKNMKAKAEEMRKLYVALTRCEQVLILVGTIKNQEDWQDKTDKIKASSPSNNLLVNLSIRQGAKSWLDWIQAALAIGDRNKFSHTHFRRDQVKIHFYKEKQLEAGRPIRLIKTGQTQGDQWVESFLDSLKTSPTLSPQEEEKINQVRDISNQVYPYTLATNTSSYQSVSELKRLYEEPSHERLSHYQNRASRTEKVRESNLEREDIQSIRYTKDTFQMPRFMEESQLDASRIGVLTHFVMQELDLSGAQGLPPQAIPSFLEGEIRRLEKEGYLSQQETHVINQKGILHFLLSPLGQDLIQHENHILREQAFSYRLPAKWIFNQALEDQIQIEELGQEQILIHGVMDSFYEGKEGITLLDYKTDRYRPHINLSKQDQIKLIVDKYRFQLSLYAQALESATGKPIKRLALVLLDFDDIYEYSRQERYRFDEA